MIWDKNEQMAADDLAGLQLDRLQKIVGRVATHVPFYRNKFKQDKFDPASLGSLDDIRQLPFTTKQDLRNNYPYGMFAVPMRDVVRIHSSSGTTGKPTVVGYTKGDIDIWADVLARSLRAAGPALSPVVEALVAAGHEVAAVYAMTDLSFGRWRLVGGVRYEDSAEWPVGADGLGYSLEKIAPEATSDDPASWMDSGAADAGVEPEWQTATSSGIAGLR